MNTVDINSQVNTYFGYTCIGEFVSNMVSLGIIVASLAVFVFLVWGGIEWITAGGDKAKTELAQKRLTGAVTGLAIVVASWAIWKILLYFFGISGDVCNPVNPLGN
ncbi:pilin [Patescibacteria group bacterium]|nr:pilin [Patescibacteria group bacterium]MBU1200543.1 pilin [Patescibacteria group bacterium]